MKPKPTHLHRRRMSRRLRSPQRQPAEMRVQRAGNGGRLSRSMTASSKNWPACLGQGPRPVQPDPDWTMPMRIVPTEEARAAITEMTIIILKDQCGLRKALAGRSRADIRCQPSHDIEAAAEPFRRRKR